MKRTKIVCTIGPASSSEKVLRRLILSGMNVARLNFSHGDHGFHKRMIETIRRLSRKHKRPVAIMQDLPGPKIRVGVIHGGQAQLNPGQRFILHLSKRKGNSRGVSVSNKNLYRHLRKGDPVLLGDGEIELQVLRAGKNLVTCKVIVGGTLGSRKGVHIPRADLPLPALTSADRRHLRFGAKQGVDLVALSFVRTSKDIGSARRAMKKIGVEIPIIAKIEKQKALEHIDDILRLVDGIMVARGDLGLEIDREKIPAVQKMLIRKANRLGKPVITATQMLRSMVDNANPSRAEVADIANAVLDGTDALMLSEESAVGDYPVEAVKTMTRVAKETESILEPRDRMEGVQGGIPEAISAAAASLARDLRVKAFLIPTTSGATARMIARHRPTQPILALSPHSRTIHLLALVWGVFPIRTPPYRSTDQMIKLAKSLALASKMIKKGDLVAITAGLPVHQAGSTNLITVQALS